MCSLLLRVEVGPAARKRGVRIPRPMWFVLTHSTGSVLRLGVMAAALIPVRGLALGRRQAFAMPRRKVSWRLPRVAAASVVVDIGHRVALGVWVAWVMPIHGILTHREARLLIHGRRRALAAAGHWQLMLILVDHLGLIVKRPRAMGHGSITAHNLGLVRVPHILRR